VLFRYKCIGGLSGARSVAKSCGEGEGNNVGDQDTCMGAPVAYLQAFVDHTTIAFVLVSCYSAPQKCHAIGVVCQVIRVGALVVALPSCSHRSFHSSPQLAHNL
jgi:hypothetical protein